jgi:hypothetical protein
MDGMEFCSFSYGFAKIVLGSGTGNLNGSVMWAHSNLPGYNYTQQYIASEYSIIHYNKE